MSSHRKRINVSITPELYEELRPLMRRAGFNNLCQLTLAALNVMADGYKRSKAKAMTADEANTADINEMFADYSDHERQPDGTVPVRHHHKTIK